MHTRSESQMSAVITASAVPVVRGGNAWLDGEFPLLDRILKASIE